MIAPSADKLAPLARSGPAAGEIAAFQRDDFDRNVWCLLGIPIDVTDIAQTVVRIEAAARDRRRLSFVTVNVNWLASALKDRDMRRRILGADLSLVDGAPLVLLARLLGIPQRQRVAGADIFEALRRRPGFPGRRVRVFFFGGRPGAARAAHERLEQERGLLEAAGFLDPGHGDIDSMSGPDTLNAINLADPDFIVVALGAEKGQAWIERNQTRLPAPVIAHLGAVIDFVGGTIRRAPAFVRAVGCEWLWRIAAEPKLWRRYARDGAFLAGALASRLPRARPKGRSRGTPADARVEAGGERVVVRVGGDATANTLDAVRAAFREAAAARRDVTLDLSDVGSVDLAFLGLVLMLEKNQAEQGLTLTLQGCSRRLGALFRANAMDYPIVEAEYVTAPKAAAVVL
jgi:N-acetylglucosaminyldiphosphoundecaprenol N-acetyl-beta-D-mannosaminyltransferase